MTTTPTSGAADLHEALHRVIDDFERRERGIPQAHIAAALVTELRASLAAGQATAAPAEPDPTPGDHPQPCDSELFESGVSVGLFDIPQWTAEALCKGIAAATGARVDWHYIGGRVHVKALPAPTSAEGVAYAALPESFLEIPDVQDESGINAYYSREAVLECIDAALASHGQAPAGAGEPTEQQILEAAFAPAQPAAEASKPIGYLNPKVLGPDGKIDAPGALTYSSRPCGGWTFPIYAAAPAQPAAQQPHRSGCTAGTDEECVQRGCGTNCPAVSPQADSVPAIQGEMNVQLDIDSNHSAPGQQRDVARSVALGQPMGNGSDQVAGHPSAQEDKLLTVAERNIRSFLRSATFKSESDREAALNCVDVLWAAARDPADSVQEDAALWHWLAEYLVGTRTDLDDEIVASETVNDLRKLVKAAIKQGEKQ